MSDFIKKNGRLVHIVSELSCLVGVILYIFKNNEKMYNHIKHLEDSMASLSERLNMYEKRLRASKPHSPIKSYTPSQMHVPSHTLQSHTPSHTLQPSHSLQSHIPYHSSPSDLQDPEIEMITTSSIDNDDLDEEIKEELTKLDLLS